MAATETNLSNTRVVICGATGFIGRNMVAYFAKKYAHVTAVWHRKPPYRTPSNVSWVQADLRDPEAADKVVAGHDILIQAAATTSGAKDITSSPAIHVTDNAVMNSHLLRAAYERSLAHFIFFSCSVMYGSSRVPVKESDFSGEIEPKYFGAGWTKVYLERMCEFYAGLGRTKHTVIRHSNIYGPHDKFDLERSHVCGATISKALTAKASLTVWGKGSESRDLLFISDLVNFVDRAATHQRTHYGLYNCGAGKAISVRDLTKKIIAASGKALKITYDPTKPTIDFSLALDCRKAEAELGWKPQVSLEDGLRETINWWQENIDPATLTLAVKS